MEEAEFAFARGRFIVLVAGGGGVDDNFFLLGGLGVLHCYFQVFSQHLGGVLLQPGVG